MEAVVVEIQRLRSFRGGDGYELFGDHGSGTLDTQMPLTDRPRRFWKGLPHRRGHLIDGHVATLHIDNVIPDGHLDGHHLAAEHLWPAGLLRIITPPLYFGTFRFAIGTVDSTQNRSTMLSPTATAVLNSSPRPATGLKRDSFDVATRRMRFTFTPSPDL